MDAIPRRRAYSGPAFLSGSFRPFFLFAALYATLTMVVWLPLYEGEIGWPSRFSPIDWHAHELMFGAVSAVIAGFLFTAIPNWTGRLPLQGTSLAVLVATWFAGRLAVNFSAALPAALAAAIDLAFLVLVVGAAAREIVAGKNWRNLRVLAPLIVLIVANALYHHEVTHSGASDVARRLALAAILSLVLLIGGRIIPSFTRNWLVRENPGRLPSPFDRLDGAAMIVGVVALGGWVFVPHAAVTGALLIAAGLMHAARLARWAGDRTTRDVLVLILHVAYAFVPLGFLLTGLAVFFPAVAAGAGLHAWTVGAIGGVTLAVMSRATLGHTGQALHAGRALQVIYALIVLAAVARIAAALLPAMAFTLHHVAAGGWILAYGGFAVWVAPLMLAARR